MSEDADRLSEWLREAARELERAHDLLDEHGVPQYSSPDERGEVVPLSLAARIETGYELRDEEWRAIC